ncbi:MAG: hypothetical protein IAE86_01710 [Burkholderiaceae bacterium]|nr:hypothetical protein [Burkholderiaceae bacterium]
MELLSVSSLIAALIGALATVGVFLFLPRIKALAATRQHVAYITAGLSLAIAAISLVNLQLANRSAALPGDVTVRVPDAPVSPASSPPALLVEPKRVSTTVSISETLDEHSNLLGTTTRQYERRFPAKQGFKIVEAKFIEKSATRVSDFQVQTTDREAIVRFRLTSGPSVDRYRGWLHGDLVLVQEELPVRP